jgi:peptide deformylase
MAILKIARMGHPVLARPSQPVADPTAPEIALLVGDMIDTLRDAGGVGLAAPQVHVPLRLAIFLVPEARAAAERYRDAGLTDTMDPEEGPVPLTVLINPEIEPLAEDRAVAVEGCLSLPGMAGEVPRFTRIRYSGLDLRGNRVERIAKGFHARVVQHECDHLDGILYPMRMTDLSRFGYAEEMRKPPIPPADE